MIWPPLPLAEDARAEDTRLLLVRNTACLDLAGDPASGCSTRESIVAFTVSCVEGNVRVCVMMERWKILAPSRTGIDADTTMSAGPRGARLERRREEERLSPSCPAGLAD